MIRNSHRWAASIVAYSTQAANRGHANYRATLVYTHHIVGLRGRRQAQNELDSVGDMILDVDM